MYFVHLPPPAGVSPLIKNKEASTKNFWRRLKQFGVKPDPPVVKKRKHVALAEPRGTQVEAAARLFGRSSAPPSAGVASSGGSAGRTYRQTVTQFFSGVQLKLLLVAATLLAGASANVLAHPFMRIFLFACSAGVISGVDPKTYQEYEEGFVTQLTERFATIFRRARLIRTDGTPIKHKLPKYSVSCDKSTTDIEGWQTITINLHFFDDSNKKVKLNLGVLKFQLSTDRAVSKGTGLNIATFIVTRLQSHGLVPKELIGQDISAYVYAMSTDNASTEVHATVEYLRCRSQTCSAHTLALVVKGALAPKGVKSHVLLLMDKLALVAKAHKIGKGKAILLSAQSQHEPPVLKPLCLLSRCKTRWSDAFWLVERAVMLRCWLDAAFLLASQPAFTAEEWTILVQVTAVMRVFHLTTATLQSRDLSIGAHLVLIYKLALQLKNPALLKFHPSDFEFTAEQLNDGVSLWSDDLLTGTDELHPEVRDFIGRAYSQILGRCNLLPHGKRQFNSITSMICLIFEPKMKWLVLNTSADSVIFSKEQKMEAKAELLRLMRLFPHAQQDADAEPPRQKPRSMLDFEADPLLDAPAAPAGAGRLLSSALPPERRDKDAALLELERWEADKEFYGKKLTEVWFSKEARLVYALMAQVFIYIFSAEHCTAECERDFSVLARLQTPLRKGPMRMKTVERKMFLLLNQRYWHPLPDRAEESMVQDMFARFRVDTSSMLVCDSDSDDDYFV